MPADSGRAEAHLDILTRMAKDMGLTPLPEEKYPRMIERNEPDKGYYIALGIIMSVWMVTPLSCAYLAWYALFAGTVGLTGTIFAAYAITEVLFAIYQHYLIRLVQAPAPVSTLPLDVRQQLIIKVLHAGLGYPEPSRPIDDATNPDPMFQTKVDLYAQYMSGAISKARYHNLLDQEYERSIGMQEIRRIAKMSEGEKEVIDAFVEEEEGDRERRLRAEVEKEVGHGLEHELNGVFDKDGNIIKLHTWDRRAVEFRERLRTWFDHAPWETLRRDNVLIWISWIAFTLPLDRALTNPEYETFLYWIYDVVEARTGTRFPKGHDPSIRIIRLTLDPVNAKSRPLILYAVTNAVNWYLQAIRLPYLGMDVYTEGGIEYLIRIPKGWTAEKGRRDPNAIPVLMLHGLGFGLAHHNLLIEYMLKTLPTHPLIVPLAHHTGQAFFHPRHLSPWTRREFVSGMKAICQRWGFWEEPQVGYEDVSSRWGGLSVLSHSNGSVAHGWLLKDCPSLVRRSAFCDPVVFCLWEGDVCHSFCYRKPSNALELLLYYFIASEIGIANYIQRHFDWADNCLFLDDIPQFRDLSDNRAMTRGAGDCQIFLGAKDIIVDARRVRRYLENHGLKVGQGLWWDENGGHGDGLSGDGRARVVNYVATGHVRGADGYATRSGSSSGTMTREPSFEGHEKGGELRIGELSGSDSDRTYVEESKKEI